MTVHKWKSEIDYLELVKVKEFNGELEFVPESLTYLDLSKYTDDYPELKELLGEKGYLDYDSPQLQDVYDFIQDNSTLSDMIYADWLHYEAEATEENLADECMRENAEHLDTILSLAHLDGNAAIGIYDHEKVFFTKELSSESLLWDYSNPRIEFVYLNPLYEEGTNTWKYCSTSLLINSIEVNDTYGTSIDISACDNHKDVEVEIIPFKCLSKYIQDNPEFKEDLKKFLNDYPEIQDLIEVYNIDLEQKNSLHR